MESEGLIRTGPGDLPSRRCCHYKAWNSNMHAHLKHPVSTPCARYGDQIENPLHPWQVNVKLEARETFMHDPGHCQQSSQLRSSGVEKP